MISMGICTGRNASILCFGFFFLLLILPAAWPSVLVNSPQAGQNLELLIEGEAAPANVTLIGPGGHSVVVPLVDGQMKYPVAESGRWVIMIGDTQMAVLVGAAPAPMPPAPDTGADRLLVLGAAVATLLFLLLVIVAVDALIIRPPAREAVSLEKKRAGNIVNVKLRAGTRPLRSVRLEDSVGPGWNGKPMSMGRQRLEAGQALEMEYEWSGDMGEVKAVFSTGRHEERLTVREGRALFGASDFLAAPDCAVHEKPKTAQAARRKLGRIKTDDKN